MACRKYSKERERAIVGAAYGGHRKRPYGREPEVEESAQGELVG
jgi:hypothetical protein